MNRLLALILAGAVSTGTVLYTEDDWADIYAQASGSIKEIRDTNKKQTLEAALIIYAVNNPDAPTPTLEVLVADGYLKPEFLLP